MAKGQLPAFMQQDKKKKDSARAEKLKLAIERRMKARGDNPNDKKPAKK